MKLIASSQVVSWSPPFFLSRGLFQPVRASMISWRCQPRTQILPFIRRMGHAGVDTHHSVARGLEEETATDAAEGAGSEFMSHTVTMHRNGNGDERHSDFSYP